MRFSFGELYVADKVGMGYFFLTFGDDVFGDYKEGLWCRVLPYNS